MTVLVVGEALVDVVQRAGADPAPHAGGSPFNVAVGLSRLGVHTRLAAQIGHDAYGELLRARLETSGGELELLVPAPVRTSSAIVTLAPDGGADYVFDLTWNPEHLPHPGEFDAVHVGSLGTSLAPGAQVVESLVAAADAIGVPVSYDPNVRLAVQPDHDQWRRVFATIAPHAGTLKMSDEDAAVLFPGENPRDLARHLAADGALVAITLGGEGAIVATADRLAFVKAPAIQVADTIGAGDSFMAAMLAWLAARQWPISLAADDLDGVGAHAAAAAAITCSRPGADPPWSDELPE
jgi:fructokinase